jgi:YD repeat-containing protein
MTARSVTLLAVAALGCSGPLEPEKAPDRVVTTESEGGSSLNHPPPPEASLRCTAASLNTQGQPFGAFHEWVDDQGRVVRRKRPSFDEEELTYDDRGRLAHHRVGYHDYVFAYLGDLLEESSPGRIDRYRVDDRDRITQVISGDFVTDRIEWFDDLRPRSITSNRSIATYSWDGEGLPLDYGFADSGSGRACERRFSWTKTDRALAVIARDARGGTRLTATYQFDAAGRLVRADGTTFYGEKLRIAWSREDGWVNEINATTTSEQTRRIGAACHYPPSRSELSRTIALTNWVPSQEPRTTHRLSLAGGLFLPSPECMVSE